MDCLGPALSWLADSVGGLASTASSPEQTSPRGTAAAGVPPDTCSSSPAATSLMSRMVARGQDLADAYTEFESVLSHVVDVVESFIDSTAGERECSSALVQPVTFNAPRLPPPELTELLPLPVPAPFPRRYHRSLSRRRRHNIRRPGRRHAIQSTAKFQHTTFYSLLCDIHQSEILTGHDLCAVAGCAVQDLQKGLVALDGYICCAVAGCPARVHPMGRVAPDGCSVALDGWSGACSSAGAGCPCSVALDGWSGVCSPAGAGCPCQNVLCTEAGIPALDYG